MSRKQWLTLFRVAVTLLAVAYVAWKMADKWPEFLGMFQRRWSAGEWALLVLSTLLMPLNYALESQKWRLMVRPFYPTLKLFPATVAVFAGMAAGIFTPNRIGEYAGRILFLKEGKRVEAIIATFVDRICQLLVTLVCGLLALGGLVLLADRRYASKLLIEPISQGIFIFICVVLGGLTLLVLLAPKRFAGMIPSRWNKAVWVRKTRFALQNLELGLILQVLGLALLRYFVFSSQYVLLMYAFQYQGSMAEAYVMVALIFLGKSILPVMGALELGVRESVALVVMTTFAVAEATVLGSTLMLYLVNLLLPTLLGVIAMQRIKVSA